MRILHTMIRVKDLDKSIEFYTEVLGMKLLSRKDFQGGEFTLAFVGFADESEQAVLELTHNWDNRDYELGNAYGHIAIDADDIYKTCEAIRDKGGEIVREPGPMKHGTTEIAFVKDPDGFMIELIQSNK